MFVGVTYIFFVFIAIMSYWYVWVSSKYIGSGRPAPSSSGDHADRTGSIQDDDAGATSVTSPPATSNGSTPSTTNGSINKHRKLKDLCSEYEVNCYVALKHYVCSLGTI